MFVIGAICGSLLWLLSWLEERMRWHPPAWINDSADVAMSDEHGDSA